MLHTNLRRRYVICDVFFSWRFRVLFLLVFAWLFRGLISGVAPANQTKERPIRKPVREFGVFL